MNYIFETEISQEEKNAILKTFNYDAKINGEKEAFINDKLDMYFNTFISQALINEKKKTIMNAVAIVESEALTNRNTLFAKNKKAINFYSYITK